MLRSRVYMPGTEQEWISAPLPLWRKRLRQRMGRIVYRTWCAGCLLLVGAWIGGML